MTQDRDFRDGRRSCSIVKEKRKINNIDAYDWDGNHLWNIADIVGDIKMAFYGGYVCTKETYQDYYGYDESKVPDSHDLYAASTDGRLYLIDLETRRITQVLPMK